ncbi:RND family efflux transporter MFP subunit [Hoeflea halophila]|uniref:RND family efflux transporter MFP subunit n=1 Tax=Hoeflea halophila TaxID=714899 RepID=A0A286IFX5_9HYPH|nr:efflux RND transporter periplasmic adaptor subunit [Hoeflea halophila]SOE19045.1 RND family efflux transporter MFP subunit [Hoeflea halophila]
MRNAKHLLPGFLHMVCAVMMSACFPASAIADETANDVAVRGVIRALHQATLSTHLRARVTALKFREGDHFSQGDTLVEFDCRAEEARLGAARAIRDEKSVRLEGAKYLRGLKAGSTQDVRIASAQVDQADADIAAIAANLDGCTLKAPFDGTVYETHIRENETPSDGARILSIINIDDPEIELIVPSNWINGIAPGRRFDFRIDETGETLTAVVRRIAPVVDPVSQTFKIYAEFAEQGAKVLPGMSGDATFSLDWQLR